MNLCNRLQYIRFEIKVKYHKKCGLKGTLFNNCTGSLGYSNTKEIEYYSCPSPNLIIKLLYFHFNTTPVRRQAVYFDSTPGEKRKRKKKEKRYYLNKLHLLVSQLRHQLSPKYFPLRATKVNIRDLNSRFSVTLVTSSAALFLAS